jgi:hypothetical protein
MGYANWRECVTAEFQNSQAYLYRQLEAAQTEKVISPTGEKPQIPERQLRPLTKLRDDPEKQKEAWQKAVESAPAGKVTAAHVYKIVHEMTTPAQIIPQTDLKEDSDILFHLKRYWKQATKKDKKNFLDWIRKETQ